MADNGRDYSDLAIAVIGNGRWAQNHIKILKECGAFNGAYDIESDYKHVIDGKINGTIPSGIVITTDPVMHFPITKYAMQSGIAVYCEKPIATQAWQLKELMKLRTSAIYQAGFQLLYDSTINIMRDHKTVNLISRRLGGNYRNESVVQTLMIHDIAVACYLFGTAKGVEVSTTWGMRSEVNANLKFPSGQSAILHSRYGLPHFRQMDFIDQYNKVLTDEFDNHVDQDLLAMGLGDWMTAIRHDTHSNRAYMRFACNVQQIAFEIDKRIGIKDSVREDRIEHEEKETVTSD